MEFKITKDKTLIPPKGFIEEPVHPSESKADLLFLLNVALDRFEDKDHLLYDESNGVMEASAEQWNKNIEVVENDTEICISIYSLEKRWIKLKEQSL